MGLVVLAEESTDFTGETQTLCCLTSQSLMSLRSALLVSDWNVADNDPDGHAVAYDEHQ